MTLASGPEMSVEGTFDTGAVIRRRWWFEGNSAKSETDDQDEITKDGSLAVMLNAETYFALSDRERVAYVGASDKMVGTSTQVIDAAGQYVLPGFLEPHCHVHVAYNPATLAMEVLTRGTTAVFANQCPLHRWCE